MLPDAVSEIRCRKSKEIPGNNNHPISSEPQSYTWYGAYRVANQTAVRRESKSEKILTA